MLNGLFVNSKKELCSIYESGRSIYNCIDGSEKINLHYKEIDRSDKRISLDYDFYIFNYHWVKMGWLNTSNLKRILKPKFCIVLETYPRDPLKTVKYPDFDAYLVLDPTERSVYSNVHFLPRPLNLNKAANNLNIENQDNVKIGSYGIGLEGKGYVSLIKAVNMEFDSAEINLNLPILNKIEGNIKNKFFDEIRRANIKNLNINITTTEFSREELVGWCKSNTINVFLYNRNISTGLSAATDQAIESGRPLLVSSNSTFRHLHPYITPYPFQSIRSAITTTSSGVKKLQKEWSSTVFKNQIESIVESYI